MSTAPAPPLRRIARTALVTLLIVVLFGSLATVVFGIVDLVSQVIGGTTFIALHARPDAWEFGMPGPGGVPMTGHEVILTSAVTGLSAGTALLGTIAAAVGVLTWAVVAWAAVTLLRGIRQARTFDRGVVRRVTVAGIALLLLGTASQLLGWWATNAALDEFGFENNASVYLRDLDFQPLTAAVGLTLLLAALAFRAGERLQRDAEGLV